MKRKSGISGSSSGCGSASVLRMGWKGGSLKKGESMQMDWLLIININVLENPFKLIIYFTAKPNHPSPSSIWQLAEAWKYNKLCCMSGERKGDKLARQSMALLERLKGRREKQEAVVQQENYIEDLYVKVFGKCSPHFDKMLTSNELLAELHRKTKTLAETQQEWESALRLNAQLKDQLSRLKQCRDEAGTMKALNTELNKLQRSREESAALIKALRRENEALLNEAEQNRQQLNKTSQLNAELEDLVHKMAQLIEENAQQKEADLIDNQHILQLKTQLQHTQRQLAQANQQLNLMKEAIAGLQLQKSGLEKQAEALKQANKNLCAGIQSYKQVVAKLQLEHEAQSAKMKEELSVLAQDMARMQTILDDCRQINLGLTARNQQLQQSLAESSKRQLEREEDLMCKVEQLQERLRFFKQSNEQLSNQKIDYINSIELLAEETKDLTRQLALKQQQLASLKESSSSELSAVKRQRQQKQKKLDEAVSTFQLLLQQRSKQSEQHKQQIQRMQRSCQSWRQEKTRHEKAMAKSAEELKQLQDKIKEQYQIIQRLQLEKHDQQQTLSQKAKQFAAQISALRSEADQLRQRSETSKLESDQLSQQKMSLLQQKERISQANNKLRTELNDKKLKLHRNQQKICELNQIINSYRPQSISKEENKNSEDVQREEQMETKCSKHISTINELSSELTDAYKVIQQLQQTISQLKAEDRKEQAQKGSAEKRQRGRSIKKIAGIFGF